jgi:hypothetical protein
MCPSAAGAALARAIDSAVRDVGRIVVWVEAAADVRTATMMIFPSRLEPNTSPASRPRTSPDWSPARRSTPPNAIAATDTTR